MGDRLMTATEVAALVRVSASAVYKAVEKGGPDALPCLRFGRSLRFDEQAVRDWMAKSAK